MGYRCSMTIAGEEGLGTKATQPTVFSGVQVPVLLFEECVFFADLCSSMGTSIHGVLYHETEK